MDLSILATIGFTTVAAAGILVIAVSARKKK